MDGMAHFLNVEEFFSVPQTHALRHNAHARSTSGAIDIATMGPMPEER